MTTAFIFVFIIIGLIFGVIGLVICDIRNELESLLDLTLIRLNRIENDVARMNKEK